MKDDNFREEKNMPEEKNAVRRYGRISKKQREILGCVRDKIATDGCPPTVREICERTGLKSTSSVHSHLNTLEKNGYIRRGQSKSRAIEVLDEGFMASARGTASVPVIPLEALADGFPEDAVQCAGEYFPLLKERAGGDAEGVFIVKAPDGSMAGMGIPEGCLVIARRADSVMPGSIAVVGGGGRAAIRMYAEDGGMACFISKSAEGSWRRKMEKEKHGEDGCIILGKAIGLMNFHLGGLPAGEGAS